MATVLYVNPDPATATFGNQLGCGWVAKVPPQFTAAATAPCVILAGAGQVAVLPDDGTLTAAKVNTALAPILTAEQAAAATAGSQAANQATIQANIQTHMAQMETWMTANPNGAVLTAAQTKFLVQSLIGLSRIMLGLTSTVGGAT